MTDTIGRDTTVIRSRPPTGVIPSLQNAEAPPKRWPDIDPGSPQPNSPRQSTQAQVIWEEAKNLLGDLSWSYQARLPRPRLTGERLRRQLFSEVGDGLGQPGIERCPRLPVEELAGAGQIGAALFWIILREGLEDDLTRAAAQVADAGRELEHGDLVLRPEVDGLGVIGRQQADDALDEVVDVTEAARLGAVPVHGHRLVLQRLHQEVRHGPPVIDAHPRPKAIKNANDAGVHAVRTVVRHGERLGGTLRLVVERARSDGIDVAPIGLGLRMDLGVAVDLGGGRKEEDCALRTRHAEHVVGAERADL